MKKALAVILTVLMLIPFAGCKQKVSNDEDEPVDQGIYVDMSDSDAVDIEDSDYLDSIQCIIGSWETVSIFQASSEDDGDFDSDEDALAYAQESSLLIGAYEFYSPMCEIESDAEPRFELTPIDLDTLAADGIKVTDELKSFISEDFAVTKVDVFETGSNDAACTLYLINDGIMLYYGPGGHVFLATKVEAEG